MSKALKRTAACIFAAAAAAVSVSAAGMLRSAEYSNSNVYLNGQLIELKNPTALITKQGEDYASSYAPVREIFEKAGYEVRWDDESRSIYLDSPDPMDSLLIAEDGDAKLYNMHNTPLIEYKYFSKSFIWPLTTPRRFMPEMKLMDYDKDGKDEIVIAANTGSGTGIDFWELHVIEITEDTSGDMGEPVIDLTDNMHESYGEEIARNLSYTVEKGQRSKLIIKYGDTPFDIDITESGINPDKLDLSYVNLKDGNAHVNYEITDMGVTMRIQMAVLEKDSPGIAIPVADLIADVKYDGGSFTLENVEIK